jgi:riboflavin transporter FmnP
MNTRAVAATVVLAAVTIVLNPAFTGLAVPTPFFLVYYFWEVPIVAAAFLIGLKEAIGITIVNLMVLLATAQGFVIQQPFYQSTAAIVMLLGIYLATRIAGRKAQAQGATPRRRLLVFTTALGIVFRVGIMAVLAFVLFRFPVIGFELPERAILAFIPWIAFYDATFALYTIPAGYFIAKTINKNLKTSNILANSSQNL